MGLGLKREIKIASKNGSVLNGQMGCGFFQNFSFLFPACFTHNRIVIAKSYNSIGAVVNSSQRIWIVLLVATR
jgi:hypothetical protein